MANKKVTVNAKSRRLMIHETTTAYLFMLPFLAFFVTFVLYPMVMCLYTSFFDSTMGKSDDVFVGLQNYIKMMFEPKVGADGKVTYGDPIFWKGLKNTLVIVIKYIQKLKDMYV